MENNMFEKFKSMVDLDGLKADIAAAEANTGDFVKIPHGDYEVKVVKIELGATGEQSKSPGAPKASVWFEVLAGDFKGQKIFMTQMLTSGFGIHKMNEFLISLETGIAVQFENFEQYAEMFAQIFDAVDGKAEYQLHYAPNKKNANFDDFKIVQKY